MGRSSRVRGRKGPEQVLNLLLDSLLTEDGLGDLGKKHVSVPRPEAMHPHLPGPGAQSHLATQLTIAASRDSPVRLALKRSNSAAFPALAAQPRHHTIEYRTRPASVEERFRCRPICDLAPIPRLSGLDVQ
jgi:hypothetical protein